MRTWLEVDFGQIEKNIDVVKGVLPEGCRIIAVVKANAYGHGDVQVAKMLEGIGIGCFAVACTDVEVVVSSVFHDVGVAEAAVWFESWQFHGVDPSLCVGCAIDADVA